MDPPDRRGDPSNGGLLSHHSLFHSTQAPSALKLAHPYMLEVSGAYNVRCGRNCKSRLHIWGLPVTFNALSLKSVHDAHQSIVHAAS